jgi:hypothetical protein
MRGKDGRQFTLFRDIDRIRLVDSIVNRHINVASMQMKGMCKAFSGLHNRAEQRRLSECWALDFQWCELFGWKDQPLNDIR